ncbi:MAG: hypothetical protein C4308_10770 [Chitinophagaceae bacterium]
MNTESKNEEKVDWRQQRRQWREQRRECFRNYCMDRQQCYGKNSHLWVGGFLLLIGIVALIDASDPALLPAWVFSWQMFLIAMALFIGLPRRFRTGTLFVFLAIGVIFLIRDYFPELEIKRYVWALVFLVIGLFFLLRPRRHKWYEDDGGDDKKKDEPLNPSQPDIAASPEDVVDSTSVFGGTKKNIVSKNFRGGDITNIFGGAELDLTQADIQGTAVLDLTQIFGGTKLIVPSHWRVKSEMAAIFGGIEDKRIVQNPTDPNKVLLLSGTSIFGGIEIRTY